jgi:hypothetical protein
MLASPAVADAARSRDAASERPPGSGVILGILVFGIVTTIAYWVVWFGVDRDILASAHSSEYYAFENSFPLADGWMVATGMAAVWALVRRRAASFFWCIASGAISVYLGALDVLFDLENGIYTAADGNTGGVVVELIINVLTLSLGAAVMIWAWAQRRPLLRLAGF